MECMEAARALKSSFFSELAMKSSNTQVLSDDLWCLTGVGGGDDFSIDEFFDLSNEDCCANINKDGAGSFFEEEEEEKDSSSLSLSSHDAIDDTNSNSPNFSPDLAIPVDDLQELELWSHLMDDSVPEANTLACPNPNINAQTKETGFHLVSRVEPERKPGLDIAPFPPTVVPVKARSKRSRTAASRSWVAGSSPRPESSSSSSSSSSPVSTLLFPPPVQDMGMIFTFGKPPVKKQKKKPVSVGGETGSNPPVQRRCTHCQVTKTPQWRAGPNGPKTLCNACGVRYKSGRLFPEYRPACSPTFSCEMHSNSHRKVLEMRKRKEMSDSVTTGLTPTTVFSS